MTMENAEMTTFNLWVTACAHVHSDLKEGRQSMAEAIAQSEFGGAHGGPPFDWNIMLHLGDISGTQAPPKDADGPPVVAQLDSGKKHRIEQIYPLLGNHDASGPGEETQWWFRKWIDPEGLNPQHSRIVNKRRPYPISGNWERYSFRVGNLLFLMIADRNDGGPPKGRSELGGWPAGAITRDTFEWWKSMVESNPGLNIITCAHHVLRDTTTASGRGEGVAADYHGNYGDAEGASYLYWVGDDQDSTLFQDYLQKHPGAIDFWLAGHTHTHPDDTFGGKRLIEERWGVTFANCAALTLHHGSRHGGRKKRPLYPMSRLIEFSPGSREVRIRCYLHTTHYAAQGWYEPAQKTALLRFPFEPG